MGNRSYPKLVDGLESADDDGSVQGANRAISASLTADSIQKEPGKFVERTAWLFVIISCLDGLDSDLLFQLIKFFNYLHTFLDKPGKRSNAFMETESIGKLMTRYAVPCVISLLVAALYNIVDQIFIANATIWALTAMLPTPSSFR